MQDSLNTILKDSIQALTQANQILTSQNTWKDNLNFYLAIAGGIGTLIGAYAFYLQWKSKTSQDYVFKLAQTAMEKEDAQSQLQASKKELNTVEKRLTELQNQIKKDLPIEARKAVLTDRLDESLRNLKNYYNDVQSTQNKLKDLGIGSNISSDLLKAIEKEIQPRHLLEEKTANYKTLLTVTSSLSGLAFAVFPYPFSNFLGITFLLLGIPMLFKIIQNSYHKNSTDKMRTTLLMKFLISLCLTLVFLFITFAFGIIYLTASRHYEHTLEFIIAIAAFFLTAFIGMLSVRYYIKYAKKKSQHTESQTATP